MTYTIVYLYHVLYLKIITSCVCFRCKWDMVTYIHLALCMLGNSVVLLSSSGDFFSISTSLGSVRVLNSLDSNQDRLDPKVSKYYSKSYQ